MSLTTPNPLNTIKKTAKDDLDLSNYYVSE